MLRVVKPDVIAAAGSLHLCAGQEAGIEAATHAMNQMFMSEETEVVLLVDATNAFNSVNRLALLHNVQVVCPGLATIAANLYRQATPLFVGNTSLCWQQHCPICGRHHTGGSPRNASLRTSHQPARQLPDRRVICQEHLVCWRLWCCW